MEEVLNTIYHDVSHPGGLRSVKRLYKEASNVYPGISLKDVKEYLKKQDAYTLHKLNKKKFARRKILVSKPRRNISADLMDISQLKRYNDNVGYILVVIDSFSRYLKLIPQKNKSGKSTLESIKQVLEDPESFQGIKQMFTDKGTEFYNKHVKQYLTDNNVLLYSTHQSGIKASIAERVIRTVRGLLYKYLTLNNTRRYIDVLKHIEVGYNRSPHRGLGGNKTPLQVHHLRSPHEIRLQFKEMYINKNPNLARFSSSLLRVGDTVRLVSNERTKIFTKSALPRNTLEIFKIIRVNTQTKPVVYFIQDLSNQPIQGLFYREELVPVTLPEYYPVDIIKKRTSKKGTQQYLVHYRGYSSNFNSWVSLEDLRGM